MERVLIADSAEELRMVLELVLEASYQVRVCADGKKGLELLQQFKPDILVVELSLPGIKGLDLIRRGRKLGLCPAVVATTRLVNDEVRDAALELEIEEVVLRPYDLRVMKSKIQSLALRCRAGLPSTRDEEGLTGAYLLEMGFCTRLRGFGQLRVGIPLYARDPKQALVKELYPMVAQLSGAQNWKQVERDMRKAICRAWECRNEDAWRGLFTPGPDGVISRPTNGAFIARMAEKLAEDMARLRTQ